jgi:hypothetical protein
MSSDGSYLEGMLADAMLDSPECLSEGYEYLYCRNHPTMRWHRRKFDPRRISNNPHLMFLGDGATGKCGSAMPVSQDRFDTWSREEQEHWTEVFAVECSCPVSDLVPIGS